MSQVSLLDVDITLTGDRTAIADGLVALGSFAAGARPDASTDSVACPVGTGTTPGQLLAELTRLAVQHSPRLCLHAGVLGCPAGTVVVPGSSGLGKSTLTAALVQAGFGYLSDEVLAVPRSGGLPARFARPIAVGPESWTVLGLDPALRPADGEERLIEPEQLGALAEPAPIRHILLAERRPGGPELVSQSRGAAVPALLNRAFNHFRDPAGSFHAVVALARQAQVWTVRYQQAPELAELLAERWL
jgi:hypothetical protein